MIDSLPILPTVIVAAGVWIAYIVLEFRASKREHDASVASPPVVVTGSGRRSTRGVRSCKREVVR